MAIQLADERRRWGSVKQRLSGETALRPLALLDPTYLAFLIDGIRYLQDNQREFTDVQVRAAAFTNSVLERGLASPDTATIQRVRLDDLNDPDNLARLAPADAAWLDDQPYFATAYTRLSD